MHRSLLLMLLITPAITLAITLAQQPADTVDILHVSPAKDFTVTGNGTGDAWKNAPWISLPLREGALTYETKLKILYSASGIYALFSCEDETISATKTEDFADLWKEDVIEIFLWTEETTVLYFEYELSPLNFELPILVPNFSGEFLGWRPWQYEGKRKTVHRVSIQRGPGNKVTGWTAEFFIPYALLAPLQNVPPHKGTQWRVNMYRIDYDNDKPSEWAWQPVKTNFHEYKSFGTMIFD
jgi:hypothetical protein